MLYAGVFGYGVWRADQSAGEPSWEQVFHTMNQNDFSDPEEPIGDETGDRTEFDMVAIWATKTRMYVGDASDDWALDEDASTPLPEAWRNDDVTAIAGSPTGETRQRSARAGSSSPTKPTAPKASPPTAGARTASAATTASSPTRRAPAPAPSGTAAR